MSYEEFEKIDRKYDVLYAFTCSLPVNLCLDLTFDEVMEDIKADLKW